MACDTEQVDAIEACRTCGIYYMSTTNYLKPLFQSAVDYPEMMLIRLELAQWKVEISESDGLPQYLCSSCIHEFQKVFKFRASCVETQDQLRAFYNMREENLANMKIKTEILDPNEDTDGRCDFIYIDDFSDGEYDTIIPFNIPHVPIKEELIEEASVPREDDEQMKSFRMAESASPMGGAGTDMPHTPKTPPPPLHQNEYIMPSAAAGPTAFVLDEQMSLSTGGVECELCQHVSPNQEEHKQHIRRVHANRDMECHICGKVFKNSTQNRFKFHLKWHNINKHVKCPQCGFVCSSSQGLKEHKRAVHAKIYCKLCGKGVLSKKMKSHLRGHEIVTQFPCEYCAEILSSEQERDSHIWKIHANENTNQIAFKREKDPSQTLSKNGEVHVDAYGKVVNVEVMCAQCNEKFAHESDLELHVKLVHFNLELHLVTEHKDRSMGHNMQTPSDTLIMHNIASSTTKREGSNYDDKGPENTMENKPENDIDDITVFEDYDNDDDSMEPPPPPPPQDPQYMTNMIMKDKKPPFFTQIHTNISNANYQNVGDDDDEVTIEHFGQAEDCAASANDEQNSATESETEIDSNSTFTPNNIPQYACAKCTNTFVTVDELREHYKHHLLEQKAASSSSSPTKSKFKCHVCDKQFDLKFSLNRHIRKHNSVTAAE